jgi:TM2 domain-containing membrane protein YozV/predicted nucleic acid-binding Zn ribbon protein
MYCGKCGTAIPSGNSFCTKCGTPISGQSVNNNLAKRYCLKCGTEIQPWNAFCPRCGVQVSLGGDDSKVLHPDELSTADKSKVVAGLLGIFLGWAGVHRFYLGYIRVGVTQIFVTLITFGFGGLWGFIEGILILAGGFNRDAQGRPLKLT